MEMRMDEVYYGNPAGGVGAEVLRRRPGRLRPSRYPGGLASVKKMVKPLSTEGTKCQWYIPEAADEIEPHGDE